MCKTFQIYNIIIVSGDWPATLSTTLSAVSSWSIERGWCFCQSSRLTLSYSMLSQISQCHHNMIVLIIVSLEISWFSWSVTDCCRYRLKHRLSYISCLSPPHSAFLTHHNIVIHSRIILGTWRGRAEVMKEGNKETRFKTYSDTRCRYHDPLYWHRRLNRDQSKSRNWFIRDNIETWAWGIR